MTDADRIRTAFERNRKAVSLRPRAGPKTSTTRVRLVEGLTCEVQEDSWKLTVDMNDKHGGADRGPGPGTVGRGALGSCLAITYRIWFAFRGVPLDALEIDVEADYDPSAFFGLSDAPAGYSEVRYQVRVESDAPEADVRRVMDEAEAHCPYLDVFARAQRVVRRVQIAARPR